MSKDAHHLTITSSTVRDPIFFVGQYDAEKQTIDNLSVSLTARAEVGREWREGVVIVINEGHFILEKRTQEENIVTYQLKEAVN